MSEPLIYAQLAKVMTGVNAVGKNDRNDAQRFQFRGIDAVLNAVGPVLRTHGVVVIPSVVDTVRETITTGNGKSMMRVSLIVDYAFYAADGSSVTARVAAEAFDFGDKATPKAMSVAFRTALIQALALPTDEPDPDHDTYDVSSGVQHDPRTAVKKQIAQAWSRKHDGAAFDIAAAAADYAEQIGGVLADADVDSLRLYLTHLTQETNR